MILDFDDDSITTLFGGIKIKYTVEITGVSQQKVQGNVFILDHFVLGDMVFRHIPAIQAPIADSDISIILGCCMFGGGASCTYDTGKDMVLFHYPDICVAAAKTWTKHNGEWRILDVQDNHFVALPISETLDISDC